MKRCQGNQNRDIPARGLEHHPDGCLMELQQKCDKGVKGVEEITVFVDSPIRDGE